MKIENLPLPVFELVQGGDSKVIHLWSKWFSQGFKDISESQAQRHVGDQTFLNDSTKKTGSDVQLLVWVLREEPVFLEQIPQHTIEHLPLSLDVGILEPLQHLQNLDNKVRVRWPV